MAEEQELGNYVRREEDWAAACSLYFSWGTKQTIRC